MELDYLFCVSLLVVSFLYASVGHGGASGYLAMMAIFSFSPEIMKPYALIMNIFVSGISFLQYLRKEKMQWKLFLTFIIFSVPMAFLGGTLKINPDLYKIILGVFLIVPVVRFIVSPKEKEKIKPVNIKLAILISIVIGFLSGLIGIGGGIILTPIVLLLSWCKIKQVAPISALFIFFNSIFGLLGMASSHDVRISTEIFVMLGIVILGGNFGAYFGANNFKVNFLKKILAFVLVVAIFKLWFT